MNRFTQPRQPRRLSLCIVMAAIALIWLLSGATASAQEADASGKLQKAMGHDNAERAELYKQLTFSPGGWKVGDVVSAKPFAVVTEQTAQGDTAVRVWTGVFFREKDDMTAYWDQLWIDSKGAVTNAHADIDEYLPGYFKAASQTSYLIREYAGKMPWIAIPTDAEAKAGGMALVPADGIVNYYHIAFTESAPTIASGSTDSVRDMQQLPAAVPLIPVFAESQAEVPADALGHWAEAFITDLLHKGIVNGYEDHTIRPQSSVTRGEFVALLVRGTGKSGSLKAASGYQDVASHWSGEWIGAAQAAGLMDAKPLAPSFQPDVRITRIDMVEFIARALDKFQLPVVKADLSFTDTAGLSASKQEHLAKAVGAGIIGGYPDGTFKPEGTLTRAEAFKVISELISLLQQ